MKNPSAERLCSSVAKSLLALIIWMPCSDSWSKDYPG